MIDAILEGWAAWWAGVTPRFAFLLALPFAVGAIGLAAERARRRRAPR